MVVVTGRTVTELWWYHTYQGPELWFPHAVVVVTGRTVTELWWYHTYQDPELWFPCHGGRYRTDSNWTVVIPYIPRPGVVVSIVVVVVTGRTVLNCGDTIHTKTRGCGFHVVVVVTGRTVTELWWYHTYQGPELWFPHAVVVVTGRTVTELWWYHTYQDPELWFPRRDGRYRAGQWTVVIPYIPRPGVVVSMSVVVVTGRTVTELWWYHTYQGPELWFPSSWLSLPDGQ